MSHRPPNHPKRSRRRGFSFIEVLFGVFAVGCCATIVAAVMPVATLSRNKADLLNRATALAQKEMEAVRGTGYANLTASQLDSNHLIDSPTPVTTDTYTFTDVDGELNDSPAKVLPSGTGTIKIEQADTELRRVTITLVWIEKGQKKSYSLATLVANL